MLRKLTDTLSSALKRRPSEAAPAAPAQPPAAATRPEDRVALLVEAGRVLSASLDYQQTLQNLAQLVLHRFADYCLIFELLDPPAMRQVASSHVDPRKEHLPKRLGELYGVFPENPRLSLWRVARSGKSELVPHSTLEMAQAVALDAEIVTIYRRLEAGSFMVLPLAARGQTRGVMLLATAESGRIFGPEDLTLGEEIAFRAGLAIDNARLYRQAQDASRAKDDFLATISHELRTPLTPVLLTATSLLQSPKLHDSLRDEVEMIERNVELEAKLIDDLLDLTRIARGQVKAHFEVRDVHRLLADVVGLCREQIREKEIQVEVVTSAAEHHVWGDAARLQQIFWNIVQNAVKFSPQGGRLELRTASTTGRLRVDVRDEGVGIAPEVLSRLFKAFEQGDHHRSRSFGGGLGLGLAIAKGLVDLHGGSLSVVSPGAGQGSTFTVTLSTVPVEVRLQLARPTRVEPAARPLRLLVVEDHQPTLQVMTSLLQSIRHQVKTASDLAGARRLAETHVFDLVVSDIGLPDGSGLDLMLELRDRYGLAGIAVSGYGMDEDLKRSKEAGFSEHLVKPVGLEQLKDAIARVAS
ncbi:MAG TPA: ATP-binding protein [Thermoanaerobaculia bacterium]|jgi:signal transduction histidine kinase|nr:ATP-binding protein [Thermoanaerobaculia bacterium]